MIVLIDNGHGITTAGKRSVDGRFLEYLWNREVAQIIVERLTYEGIDARLLVPETDDVTLRNRVNRVNTLCNKVGTRNVILISIHANACGNGREWMKAQGWSAYTSVGKTQSDTLAEFLYNEAEQEFKDRKIRTDKSDGDRDWEANFTLLQKTKCPAVLTENFFYDNKEECAWLLTEDAKRRCAEVHVRAIIKYICTR